MNKFFIFLNNGRKDLKPSRKNIFFSATLFIVLLNIILFAALGPIWHIETDNVYSSPLYGYGSKSHWRDVLYFSSLLQTFLSAFSHFTWQHVLLNMLCFFVCGIYLERKLGSVEFFLLVIGLTFFGNCAVAANNNSINFFGFSGVNYSLYAYVLIDFIFCLIVKERRNKLNVIYGAAMLLLIYFAMCFKGGTSKIAFAPYPYDALNNLGHYTSYTVGLVISFMLCLNGYFSVKKAVGAD